jgi:hypothetical protein
LFIPFIVVILSSILEIGTFSNIKNTKKTPKFDFLTFKKTKMATDYVGFDQRFDEYKRTFIDFLEQDVSLFIKKEEK